MSTPLNSRSACNDYYPTIAGVIKFTEAASESIYETGIDPADDVERLLDGKITLEELLEECLNGAGPDREQGWREYVGCACTCH